MKKLTKEQLVVKRRSKGSPVDPEISIKEIVVYIAQDIVEQINKLSQTQSVIKWTDVCQKAYEFFHDEKIEASLRFFAAKYLIDYAKFPISPRDPFNFQDSAIDIDSTKSSCSEIMRKYDAGELETILPKFLSEHQRNPYLMKMLFSEFKKY